MEIYTCMENFQASYISEIYIIEINFVKKVFQLAKQSKFGFIKEPRQFWNQNSNQNSNKIYWLSIYGKTDKW